MEIRSDKIRVQDQERTLKDLSFNVEALLCYVAGWISGIVFLVLEQKNRYIRFHALQSIIVFGTLTLANIVFGHIPFVGTAFSVIIGITGFILWIILMVKAVNGDIFKLPWAGDLAERLAGESLPPPPRPPAGSHAPDIPGEAEAEKPQAEKLQAEKPQAEKPQAEEQHASYASQPVRPPAARAYSEDTFQDRYYSDGQRTGRMTGSAFAIAWSVVLLIFFNFYNQYIAWFEPIHSGGATSWHMHTLITAEFETWLPIVTATLVLSIIGHAVAITFDRYSLRQTVRTVLDVMSTIVVVSLLTIFPFDFSVLPGAALADGVTIGVTIGLICIAAGCGISALVNFIQLIIHVVKGDY